MLKRAKKVQRLIPDTRTKPKTVLREVMRSNYTIQKQICETFIEKLKDINPKDPSLKYWYKELTEAQERAIDCAHKLAPYEHQRLESIELKQTVEHRMVMRAPAKIQSVEEWAKVTGASMEKLDKMNKEKKEFKPPAPSIHDFDEDNDELITQEQLKRLN